MPTLHHRIFLSHSSVDHDFCTRLVDDLRLVLGENDAVWYDEHGGVYSGEDWWPQIEQELQASTIFIVILSPNAMASDWINDEIDSAWQRQKQLDPERSMQIIPLLYQSCEIRPDLASLHSITFLPPRTYEAAFQEILATLGLPSALTSVPENIETLRVLRGHTGLVRSMAWSGDGQTLASGSSDHMLKLWQARTGQSLRTFSGHASAVFCVAWSPDGLTLASGSADKTIKLWNVQTGQTLHTLTGHTRIVHSIAWSPDGLTLASGSGDTTIRLWNTQTGQTILTLKDHTNYVQCVAWSPDGLTLASGSADKTIKLWHAPTGQLRQTLQEHTDTVHSIAWSSDKLTLASGSADYTVRVWNGQTGQIRHTLTGHKDTVHSVAWHADGLLLTSASDNKMIKLWHARTAQPLGDLSGHTGAVFSVAWSNDGLTLASGSADSTIRLWGAKTQRLSAPDTVSLSIESGISAVDRSSPNSEIFTSGNGPSLPTTIFFCYSHTDEALLNQLKTHLRPLQRQKLVEFWYEREIHATSAEHEAESKKKLDTAQIILLLISPDFIDSDYFYGKEVKRALERHRRGEATVIPIMLRPVYWHGELADTLQTLPIDGKAVTNPDWHIQDKAFYHVANDIASAITQLTAPLVSTTNASTPGLFRPVPQHQPTTNTGGLHISVPMPRPKEALFTLTGHTNDVYSVAFRADGLTLTSVSGNKNLLVKLWHTQTGQLLRTFSSQTAHKGTITGVAWSPNGQILASSSYDKTIKLWNIQTGQAVLTLKGQTGHKDAVTSVTWRSDGLVLTSGSIGGAIKLWNALSGELIRTLQEHTSYVGSVAWSPDGLALASGSISGTIKLWYVNAGQLILADHKDALWSVAWSPDGQTLASGSADKTLKLWHAQSGQLLHTLTGHTGVVTSVAWNPDGQIIASGSADKTIKLWHAQSGQLLRTFTGHLNTVYRVAWSPDSQLLASGSADKTIKLWAVK